MDHKKDLPCQTSKASIVQYSPWGDVIRSCDYRATPIVIKDGDYIDVTCKCPTGTTGL